MNDTTTPKPKRKLRTSPIRYEAVLPFLLFVLIVWAYFFFFFDTHLRHGIQYVMTHANGAEVDIANVRTSFWNASLEINKIEVTDGTTPSKNKIQLGRMHWHMLWDALLRGKIAIDDASITDIAVGVPRAHPGFVLPPPPPSAESGFTKLRKAALENAQKEFSKNILGDVAGILNGVNPTDQLNSIKGSLKSNAMIEKLQADLKTKQTEWKTRIDALPQKKDLDDLQTRFKAVKLDHFSGPGEVQSSVQQLTQIYNDADSKYKQIESTANSLKGDLGTYQGSLAALTTQIQADVKDLESRLKIPKLDAKTLSSTIFGPLFLDKVRGLEFYVTKAREYMPPKKTTKSQKEENPLQPHERAKGRDYRFGRPHAYPLFWLKHAELSSKLTPGADYSGDLVGTLTDITNDPPLVGRPMVATFQGDFPKLEFHGVLGRLTIDHTGEDPLEKIDLKVGEFPINAQRLVDTEDVKLGFERAQAGSSLAAELHQGEIKLTTLSLFQRAHDSENFLTAEAKQPILNEILRAALASIPKVDLNASVAGPWSELKFNIESNLGRELSSAFDKQIQSKIAEARAKLQSFVNDQIGKQRAQLTSEFNAQKTQVDGILKGKEDEINKVKTLIDQAKNQAVKGGTKQLQDQGQKVLDSLKDKFHF